MKTITTDEVESGEKSHSKKRINKSDFRHHLFIESYGVKIRVTCNSAEGISDVGKIIASNFPGFFREIEETKTEHNFLLVRNRSGKDSLYKNGESLLTRIHRESLLEFLVSKIRLAVAEFANGRVFVHAGVVNWNGKAIVFPGQSFSGKTTLVAALVKRGALYYSDEYAILDEDGFVHPFPKPLSIRGILDDYRQIDYPVEALGGKAATEKSPVGMVLITEYKQKAKWNPKILSPGNGIMEIIKNTIPIKNNPKFVLNVLNKMVCNAVITKSSRGEISKVIDSILDFYEAECF